MVTRHEYLTAPPRHNDSIISDALILSSIGAPNPQNMNYVPAPSETGGGTNENRKHLKLSFPLKLMAVLDSHEHDDSISWDDNGKSFTVHDPKTLVIKVIPRYFKASSFPSFKRKLYRWGFTKLYTNDYSSASTPFFHKKFIRGNHALCKEISCSVSKDLKSLSANKQKITLIQPKKNSVSNTTTIPHATSNNCTLLHLPSAAVTVHTTNHNQATTSSHPYHHMNQFSRYPVGINPVCAHKQDGGTHHGHTTNPFPYPIIPKPIVSSNCYGTSKVRTERPMLALESDSERHFRMLQIRNELYWNNRIMTAATYNAPDASRLNQSFPSREANIQNDQEQVWQRRFYGA